MKRRRIVPFSLGVLFLLGWTLSSIADGSLSAEPVVTVIVNLLLASPYFVLAYAGRQARPLVWIVALLFLLLATAYEVVVVYSGPTGGVAALGALALQWAIAALTYVDQSRRPTESGENAVPATQDEPSSARW